VATWVAIPLIFVATNAVDALQLQESYDPPGLVVALDCLFLVGVSGVVAVLVARSFFERGNLGLLLLSGGVLTWSFTVVASGVVGMGRPDVATTIYDSGAVLAGAAQALAATLPRWGSRTVGPRRRAALLTWGSAFVVVAAVSFLDRYDLFPPFFVNGTGDTPLGKAVMGAAVAAYAIAAAGLARGSSQSAFRHWYALGLALTAAGLYGDLVQEVFGGVLGWMGRGMQYLGSLSMLAAALASIRESQSWALPLGALLRESEARYRALFENISEGFLLAEASGGSRAAPEHRVVDANPAAEALLGVARARTLGQRLRDLYPGVSDDVVERCLRVATTGEPTRFALLARERRHLDILVFRPEPGRLAFLTSDDTDRYEAERALAAANQRLAEADQNKSRFLAVLSHELRNPLAPIQNSVFILEHAEPGSPQARRAHEILARQVNHLTRLVDELLDVTRISSGRIELRRAVLDLADLVRRAGEDRRDAIEGRGIRFRMEVDPAPLPVDGDPVRLSQVVGNLLQNAAKFTPSGGMVTLALAPAPGAAEIRVRDTGVGIAPELLGRIFEPFAQGPQSLARSEGGLGLGLALVRAFVELHGGTVEARSEGLGKGAEVVVRLPRTAA
jgi:PAS domain S-box-containing protein